MLVVDTNVIIYYAILNEFTARAHQLLKSDPDWHAPMLWRSEMRNALAGEIRRRGMSTDDAAEAMEKAERRLAGHTHEVSSAAVFALVAQSQCTAYDLEFVALAQALAVPLVTMDRQLLQAFPGLARPLAEF